MVGNQGRGWASPVRARAPPPSVSKGHPPAPNLILLAFLRARFLKTTGQAVLLGLLYCLFGILGFCSVSSDVNLFKQTLAWAAPIATTASVATAAVAHRLPESPG